MSDADWILKAQRGYFSHDHDPESWDFRAKTLPGLGLVDNITFSTDGTGEGQPQKDIPRTQWHRFVRFVQHLNEVDSENEQYKIFYLVRHGQGIHNVKEAEAGREEWDRRWAKVPGDGVATWLDAELTAAGEQQARDIASIWGTDNVPSPQSIYSSPLRRCLRTTELAFAPVIDAEPGVTPIIKEKLRERLNTHTCNQRSSRAWIATTFPRFEFEHGFAEADQLWSPDRREIHEEHTQRSKELLDDIFTHDDNQIVALVAHSVAIKALFAATGWQKVPVAAGSVYPLLVCRSRVKKEEESIDSSDSAAAQQTTG